MEEIIINIIVASAVLFMIRWFATNFTSKPDDDKQCGSCPSCENSASETDTLSAQSHPVTK